MNLRTHPRSWPRSWRWLARALGVVAALSLSAPGAFGWAGCKEAVASGQIGLAQGFNRSIYFMLGMVALVSGGFTFLIWNSYRTARLRNTRAHDEPAPDERTPDERTPDERS